MSPLFFYSLSPHNRGLIALVLLAMSWASFGVFARILSAELALFQQIYFRLTIGLILMICLYPESISVKALRAISRRDWGLLALRMPVMYLLGVATFTQATVLTSLGNVAFISTIPVGVIWGVLIFNEKLNVRGILLLVVSVIGVTLISLKQIEGIWIFGEGELLALASALFFSLSMVTRKLHSDQLKNSQLTILSLAAGSLICLVSSLILNEPMPEQLSLKVVITGIVAGACIAGNGFLVNYGFEKVSVILASSILTVECVFSLLLGFIIYTEPLEVTSLFGGFLVLSSVVLLSRNKNLT